MSVGKLALLQIAADTAPSGALKAHYLTLLDNVEIIAAYIDGETRHGAPVTRAMAEAAAARAFPTGVPIAIWEVISHRATEDAYRAAARARQRDGEIEVDDINAPVSISEDGGAYVQAWLWIPAEDAGVCIHCGEANADNGEGYEGLCGNCADFKEGEE